MTRRALTLVAPTGLLLGACSPALATLVTEPEFTIDAPAGWERAEGAASGAVSTRKVVVFHPPGDLETNVNIITTLASVELTKLSALGSAYEFGFRLVVSQDRRSRRVGSQAAELLNTEDRDGYYLVEYTLQVRPRCVAPANASTAACLHTLLTPCLRSRVQRPDDNIDRHLYSYVALKSSGGYNKFYTVTGQYRAADKEKFDKLVADCVTSFRLTA